MQISLISITKELPMFPLLRRLKVARRSLPEKQLKHGSLKMSSFQSREFFLVVTLWALLIRKRERSIYGLTRRELLATMVPAQEHFHWLEAYFFMEESVWQLLQLVSMAYDTERNLDFEVTDDWFRFKTINNIAIVY